MRTRTTKKINDEIKQLNRLIKKNKADKRNEVRQNKVKTLKKIVSLNKKLKSKKIKPKQYSIQYKDLTKKLKSYRAKRIKITKDDFKGYYNRDIKYAEIYNWKNSLARGIVGAFARGGRLDDILGFDVASYISNGPNYTSIIEKLRTDYKEEFYNLLDQYFTIGNFTFADILSIMAQERYAQRLDELFYESPNHPFDINRFETKLSEFMNTIRSDYSIL